MLVVRVAVFFSTTACVFVLTAAPLFVFVSPIIFQVSPLIRLDDSIEGDECSSRTASDVDISNAALSDSRVSFGSTGTRRQHQHQQPQEPADLLPSNPTPPASLDTEAEGRAYCSSPEDSDVDDNDYGGNSSQGGFWYGDGGGASALEAAMGQWGGDYINAAAVTGGDGDVRGGREEEDDDDEVVVVASVLGHAGEGVPISGEVEAAKGTGDEEEDEDSWEIVDAPLQWEGDRRVSGGQQARSVLVKIQIVGSDRTYRPGSGVGNCARSPSYLSFTLSASKCAGCRQSVPTSYRDTFDLRVAPSLPARAR